MASEQQHSETPERFVPGEMRGQLLEAEHLARYHLARGLAVGRRVLDAGCGTGYGTIMLLEAGAEAATGLDRDEAALGAAAELGSEATFTQADLAELPFADASFDLVVCFEAIEHVEDPGRVLAELRRVLTGPGVLIISSPNRDHYPPGNPHHRHEFVPEELRAALAGRFAHVALLRQQAWTTSLIQDDAGFAADGLAAVDLELAKVTARRPGEETYTVALASDVELPEPRGVGVVTAAEDRKRWLELFDEQQQVATDQARVMAWHAEENEERLALHQRLREVEAALQRVPTLEKAVHDERRDRLSAETQLTRATDQLGQETIRADRAERVRREVMASISWRLTAPLRALKR